MKNFLILGIKLSIYFNSIETTNSREQTEDLNNIDLIDIQNELEKRLNPSTVKSIESIDGMLIMTIEMMNIRPQHGPERDYEDQLLNDVAEILVYDITILNPSLSKDEDRYWMREQQKIAEQYLKDLQEYIEKKKTINFKRTANNEDFTVKFYKKTDQRLRRAHKRRANEKLAELTSEESTPKRYKKSDEEKILTALILSRVAMMKTDELTDFIQRGCKLTGRKNFVQDLFDFVKSKQALEKKFLTVFDEILKHNSNSSTQPNRKTLFGLLEKIIGRISTVNPNALPDEMLDEFFEIIFPRVDEVLDEQLRLWTDMKKFVCIVANSNKTIRITIKGTEAKRIGDLFRCLEKKMDEDFPIYEIKFEDLDLRQKVDLMNISHKFMKRITRISFEKCLFENDIFDFSFLNYEYLDKIRELQIIQCNMKSISTFVNSSAQNCSKILERLKVFDIQCHKLKKFRIAFLK